MSVTCTNVNATNQRVHKSFSRPKDLHVDKKSYSMDHTYVYS